MTFRNIILLLIISFYTSTYAQDKVIDQILAIVGNNIILKSDVENQYLQTIAQGIDSYGDLKCEIFEDLLYQKLLLNQAILDSIEVTEKEIEQRLDSRLNMILGQAGSEEALVEYFNKPMAEIKKDLRTLLKDQLLTQKMQSKITEDIKITPSEVRKYYKSIPKDSLPLINAEIEISQIVRKAVISQAQIDEVKQRLQGYIERVNGGDNFTTLAILYSQDPGSAKNGGELGYVSRNDLVPEFAAVAFNLKNPDDISGIVETDFGYHVIQLIDRKGERINIRHILLMPKVDPAEIVRTSNLLDSITTLIRLDTLTFSEAAKKFSEDEESKFSGGIIINPSTGLSKFSTDEIDQQTYYAIKNLKVGEISNPVETRDRYGKSTYKILMVKSRTEPHVADLTNDYHFLQEAALDEKKGKAVDLWIENKQKNTYIKIDESYKNCSFRNSGWIK